MDYREITLPDELTNINFLEAPWFASLSNVIPAVGERWLFVISWFV